MKPYRDAFGNKLTKHDVTLAVHNIVRIDSISTMRLNRLTGLGIMKSSRILKLLEHARVIGPSKDGQRWVIIKGQKSFDAAQNAALRQLKKGKNNDRIRNIN